jgi:glycolate oxidase FAD binding subunit
MDSYRPSAPEELCELVREALSSGTTFEVVGSGSRLGFGRPIHAQARLDLGAFAGIRVYEPHELVLTVGAATPLDEIEALLANEGQRLAFEPPDLGPLWGLPPGQGTIGGALSVGLGGSGRVTAGAPRDHFLGFKAVSGFGEAFAAGGRVVKNVTGYDLPKLMAGSFGTLGLMTEVTIKVLPRPEATTTLAAVGLGEAAAVRAMGEALSGPFQVTAAAHLPADLSGEAPLTLFRLESVPPSLAAATEALAARLGTELVALNEAPLVWNGLGAGKPFAGGDAPVWRLSLPPARAAATAEALRRIGCGRLYFDWAGAALWVEGPNTDDVGAAAIRQVLREVAGDGHATLMRAPVAMRASVDPFEPQAAALAALTARVKSQFDPKALFNPGRMYRGV